MSSMPDPDYQLLFESTPIRHMLLTLDLRIAAVSDAFLKASMTERESIIGRYLFEVFPDNPDDASADGSQNLRASLQRVLETRKPEIMPVQKYDIRRPQSEGGGFEERYWSPVNSPVINAAGDLIGFLQHVDDVTEYVKLQRHGSQLEEHQAALQAQAQHMEIEIWQRSQEVARANRELQEANNELRTLTYSVAHDLGAPLRAINSFARMLAERNEGRLDEESQRLLRVVSDNALTMGKLIEGLLRFSGVGHTAVHMSAVDMNELVKLEVADLQRLHPHCFTVHPLPPVRGDSGLLRQVWANLLHNACKFSADSAAPEIEIGSYEDGPSTVFFVRDNGSGFDMQHVDKLFGVFQRLHAQHEYPGAGIGLALVQRIVARHEGRVWAEGKPGKGASFYFSLPRLDL